MLLAPPARKLALTVHVVASVGWLGAVATSLAVSLIGMTSDDLSSVRAAYLVLEDVGWYVLVPMSLASLGTGLVSSLGTTWGLFRHYWVVAKLVINLIATAVLIMYMGTLASLADLASGTAADLDTVRSGSPVLHATGALGLLVLATVLAMYKPRGLTRHGWRRQQQDRIPAPPG